MFPLLSTKFFENVYFYLPLECAAPKDWLKYTTPHYNCSFPGLNSNDTFDELMNLLKLLTSQSPDAQIVAQIALEGGFDPCANSSGGKRKKRSTQSLCAEGFSADTTNRICYKSTEISQYQSDGIFTCNNYYDADLVMFYNDSYAQGFLALLKSGKAICSL